MPRDRLFGVYPAIVTDLVDPEGQGRIQVSLPWLGEDPDNGARAWARLVSPYADDEQGLEILPEVDSEVVVAFEAGDARRPYVLGAAWNGREELPVPADADNNLRVLRTRAGSVLEFDDTEGAAKISLRLASGQQLVLSEGSGGSVEVQQGGSSVVMTPSGVVVETGAFVEIKAAQVKVTAGMVQVDAAMSRFSGVLQCNTLIADTAVVSPTYTPGAGNLW